MEKDPNQFAEEGKSAFAAGRYAEAADAFRAASQGFSLGNDSLHVAEMNNNLSVALLQDGKPQEALDAAMGTDLTFAAAGDLNKQAMALGNQAAALQELKRYEEAIPLYERAAELFEQTGEGDMRSMVLKSVAAIRMKQGKINQASMEMLGSLGAVQKPTLLQRFLKFIIRLKP
jgi:tetratricopeptide (TPR) repeat protein